MRGNNSVSNVFDKAMLFCLEEGATKEDILDAICELDIHDEERVNAVVEKYNNNEMCGYNFED